MAQYMLYRDRFCGSFVSNCRGWVSLIFTGSDYLSKKVEAVPTANKEATTVDEVLFKV